MARDIIHDACKEALEKDGWITIKEEHIYVIVFNSVSKRIIQWIS